MSKIERALISVSDKTGVVNFARGLVEFGIEILSTGGTAKLLREAGLKVKDVSEFTGFPEMLDGRVKTLHPKVHGAILGMRSDEEHMKTWKDHGIEPIDMVVVNLYPFEATVAKPGCSLETAIENIDIGGPTMLRSAAKNNADVTVLVDSKDYQMVLEEMKNNNGSVSPQTNFWLAVKVYQHTAAYDGAISNYLGARTGEGVADFPDTLTLQFKKSTNPIRYGENPHQKGALYLEHLVEVPTAATAKLIQGKELSYNNIADTDMALECIKDFSEGLACVIVKHANPCGVAFGASPMRAYIRAYSTDPESAFGGVIAFNCELDGEAAMTIIQNQFVEVIIAPKISSSAAEIIASKKNVRLLECGVWSDNLVKRLDFKRVNGGLLVQETDIASFKDLTTVTKRHPTDEETENLFFAWRIVKHVKSNGIVYCKNGMTIGVGAGQMSRVNSARIAGWKATDAKLDLRGSVMASDAFLPFRDAVDKAAELGITAIIQPGGSIKDEEVKAAANEHNMAMFFTGMRHFRH